LSVTGLNWFAPSDLNRYCGYSMSLIYERPPVYADCFKMECERCEGAIETVSKECLVMHCAACSTDCCSQCIDRESGIIHGIRHPASPHGRLDTAGTATSRADTPGDNLELRPHSEERESRPDLWLCTIGIIPLSPKNRDPLKTKISGGLKVKPLVTARHILFFSLKWRNLFILT